MKTLKLIPIILFIQVLSSAQPQDSIFVIIKGDTIQICNNGVYENCASNFLMNVTRFNPDTIIVKEIDIATQYATCNCYFDLSVSLTGLPAGTFYVKVFRSLPLIYPDTLLYIGSTQFTYGGSAIPYSSARHQSECYQINDIDEPVDATNNFGIEQNYPNPFNPVTVISYQLPVSSNVTLKVIDVLGNEVAVLVNEYKPAGKYKIEFQSTAGSYQLASGIYFYKLQAGDFVETKKMILLK